MRSEETKVKIFHCTYPNSPTYCEIEKIHEADFPRERFSSTEKRFRSLATEFGIDLSRAFFVNKRQTMCGLRTNLSALFAPVSDSSKDYYKIGFYA